MIRPPAGLCLPCRYRRCRDADTVEVSLIGSFRVWAIRLIDCWAPEVHGPQKEQGLEATRYAQHILQNTEDLHLFIPAPHDVHNLLSNITFDRIPGHLFIDSTTTLSEMLVRAGHATTVKKTP